MQHQLGSVGLSGGSEDELASSPIPIAISKEDELQATLPRKFQPPLNVPRHLSLIPSSSRPPSSTPIHSTSTRSNPSLLPTNKQMFPSDLFSPTNTKNDANQFFLLLNGPFYFTFNKEQPSVSPPQPIFFPLPAFTQSKPTQVLLPLMTLPDAVQQSSLDEVKVLPEPSFSPKITKVQPIIEPIEQDNLTEAASTQMPTANLSKLLIDVESENSMKNLTVLTPISSAKQSDVIKVMLNSSKMSLEVKDSSNLSIGVQNSSDIVNKTVVMPNSFERTVISWVKSTSLLNDALRSPKMLNQTELFLPNATILADESPQEVSKKKSFEDHLAEFLRSFLD